MSDVHLLPCPFCGAGKTELRENDRPWLGTRYGEPVSISVRHWCEPVVGQPSRVIERVGRDLASAVAAWNRRAAPEPPAAKSLPGEIEQLRRDVERLREDAARYRLLRKGAVEDVAVVRGLGAMDYGMSAVGYTYSYEIYGDNLDAAIDEAMKKEVSND